ncbi:Peptidoglycan/LPS O-acetylase OafA/YrhL, contains acyltransferase and SGNH-hydrolase domains [Izhakiella capsodis]|uniref:Peptidoglycan/LPS O-acetylase OafA/YrhL, contains acyltransferase and SGNH-hydrolase domains n=1 Tax=Izhakiella capsodis TaxID=1367852 RepID=A0A1I5BC40_9GAMM|nr:acyltransferase [Izhakiella capsodis]SFN72275.1 Peptidoglycan/LPS O-acetylase OafA/YrhL, contains acyltransferase and SGNH-hydrolase domains [Izhakiella capsodis]
MMKNKLESIQILRGLAVLSVVLFHYRFYLVPDGASLELPNKLFGWGNIGVDLFFVISGFIMVYVTDGKVSGLNTSLNFIVNRLTRVLPTYYIILLFAFLTGGAMSILHHPAKVSNLISALTFHPNLTNPAPLYVGESSMLNIRWTLNYEIYFYLAFAVCLLIKPRLFLLICWLSTPVIVAYFLMPNVTFLTSGYEFSSVMARFLTNPIILEFGIGAIAGYIFKHLKNSNELFFLALAIISLISIVFAIANGYLEGFNLITACSFAMLVITFSLADRFIVQFTPRFLIKLGDISFSLYLIHNPLANFLSDKVENIYPNAMHSTLGVIILLTASILMAILSHEYVEVRLSGRLRHTVSKYMPGTSKKINQDVQAM